ncbi:proteinric peroxidase [Saguinus oedipus]|uniref:Proteinric peroxidase n=1 Tax=Saguinus oedipus TaxID=9490 RepID=A0ABQ9TX10_SAGOE|nr:proteinric peroxidase [Saguinus oedipus]
MSVKGCVWGMFEHRVVSPSLLWHPPAGPLPKPSLQAVPSSLVPLEKPVTLRCQGPPGVDLYRLEKLSSNSYRDQAVLLIPAMKQSAAGRYRCSYQNGSRWSPPSDQLELIATGVFPKPSLSAQPGPAVSPGGDVTLQCQTKYGFDQFALYKEGDPGPYKNPERWYRASFPITTVTAAHSGTYRCYSFSRRNPYLWSAPSDPLELVVTGISVTPSSQLPTEPPSSAKAFPEATSKLIISLTNKVFTTAIFTWGNPPGKRIASQLVENNRISDNPKMWLGGGTGDGLLHLLLPLLIPPGPSRQYYTKGNLVRICLGAVILILLSGFLAEDWHSRRKRPRHRVRAVQRPLPPLPQPRKSHRSQDGGRPDVHSHGFCS